MTRRIHFRTGTRLRVDGKPGRALTRCISVIRRRCPVCKWPAFFRSARRRNRVRRCQRKIPVALEDAEAAMRLTRDNAPKWHLKRDVIGMMGFSAGGHLAAKMGMVAPPDVLSQ